jgi:hypothetical protein
MTENNDIATEAGRPSGGYGADTGTGNPDSDELANSDWNREIPDSEAQETAREADPDDLGGTSLGSGLTAGGDDTQVRSPDEGRGGTPLTEGYVTGGTHRARLEDVQNA